MDTVARRAIEKRGLSERVNVIAGDMLAGELPGGFDLHLISNVLHDWDAPVARQILAKSARALTPGGTLIIHDAHINETKTGPLPVAKYSALLMHSTEGKCYSLAEMRGFLGELGLTEFQFRETAVDRSIITVRNPA